MERKVLFDASALVGAMTGKVRTVGNLNVAIITPNTLRFTPNSDLGGKPAQKILSELAMALERGGIAMRVERKMNEIVAINVMLCLLQNESPATEQRNNRLHRRSS